MLGAHAIKTWSSTQAGVSLSSGEAEFNGVIEGAGMGLGFQALLSDLGVVGSGLDRLLGGHRHMLAPRLGKATTYRHAVPLDSAKSPRWIIRATKDPGD